MLQAWGAQTYRDSTLPVPLLLIFPYFLAVMALIKQREL
jgi:hypothetical protein